MHLLGTGVMAVHTDTLNLPRAAFPSRNMADIWVGLAAQQQQVGMVAVRRTAGWVRFQKFEQSIYSEGFGQDCEQTELVNSLDRWRMFAAESVVTPSDFEERVTEVCETG